MTPAFSRHLNTLGLLSISCILLYAFLDQLVYHDLPCPLCLLQRAGFVAAGFGLALNLRFGPRPSHYAVTVLGALLGAVVAARQILLHIVPGTGTYGQAIFGLHFYTLAFIAFAAIVTLSAMMLLFDGQFAELNNPMPKSFGGIALAVFVLFALVTLGNAASTILECAGGLCPDDPTHYQLIP